MKTIEVTDEMYEFLMNLSHELNTQDNRATANPYFYQIRQQIQVPAPNGCGYKGWNNGESTLTEDDEIKEAVFEIKDWELGVEEYERLFDTLDEWDIDSIMENEYDEVWVDDSYVYQNAFLTEKACKHHIECNRHHYNFPVDYLSHAYRNPELEKVLDFLTSLSE